MHIILASQSPRRKEILEYFNLPFTVQSSGFDESLVKFNGSPKEFVLEQAMSKALVLKRHHENSIIISADTTVYLNGKNYEKPLHEGEAMQFLQELNGKTHHVYTGMCITYKELTLKDCAETKVSFHHISNENLKKYIDAVYPMDKAGGYAIQGAGSLIVSKIDGCYYNVMGLPIHCLSNLLKKVGVDLWDCAKK